MEAKKAAGYFTAAGADRRRAEGDGRAQDRGILSWATPTPRARSCRRRPSASARTRCWRPGLRGELAHFTVDHRKPRHRRAGRLRADPRQLSRRQRAVPRALAPFRARRARSVGRTRGADRMESRRPRRRARSSISRSPRCCSTPAPGPSWKYLDPGDRAGRHALRRARRREPAHVRGGRVLVRSRRSAARRRGAADASASTRTSRDGFQSMVGNRLVGVEGRAALLASLGRGGRGEAGGIRTRGSRAAGRPLRPSRGAGGGRAPPGAAHPRSRCSNISGRSGRAG